MTLHVTFHGGPADGTDRDYPYLTRLPSLWWQPPSRATATSTTPGAAPGAAPPPPGPGAVYQLTGPHPNRPDVWIYTATDPRG